MRHEHMMELARHGATIRLAELEKERTHLERFLGVNGTAKTRTIQHGLMRLADEGTHTVTVKRPVRTGAKADITMSRRKMSAAARKAVSKRMKAYWAERRAAAK